MRARCPQCNACITELPSGRLPTSCPKCSNEFRVRQKESGEAGKKTAGPSRSKQRTESAESPVPKVVGRLRSRVEESQEEKVPAGRQNRRPVRGRQSRNDEPLENEFDEDDDDFEDDNEFAGDDFNDEDEFEESEDRRQRSGSSESRRRSGSRERPSRVSSEERRRKKEKRSKSAEAIFGISDEPAPINNAFKPKANCGIGVVGIVVWATCLLLGVGVLAGIKHRDKLLAWANHKPDAGLVETRIENRERNYAFLTPVGPWKQVTEPSDPGADAVFERTTKPAASIVFASGEYGPEKEPSLNELADSLSREWRTEMASYLEMERTSSSLANLPSMLLVGEGLLDGVLIRREAQLVTHEGIWYRFTIASSPEDYSNLAKDFEHARAGFTVLGSKTKVTKEDKPAAQSKSKKAGKSLDDLE